MSAAVAAADPRLSGFRAARTAQPHRPPAPKPHTGLHGALKRAKDGSALKKRFKAAELRSRLADVKAAIAMGHSDGEIAEGMSLSAAAYNELKRELFRQETAAIYAQSTEEVFLEYAWKQNQCVTDLDVMINGFKTTKQYNALVGAVRAKSDIIDKIVKTGQDMGVLERAPERKMILHGVAVANLDNNGLRKLIAQELSGLSAVMSRFGDQNIMGEPITVTAEPAAVPSAFPALPAGPSFTGQGKPPEARGGKGKAAGGVQTRTVNRVKPFAPPPA